MSKHWLVGVAALTAVSGAAFAQDVTTSTSSSESRTAPAPVAPSVGTYSASHTQESVDANGTAVVKKQTYNSGPSGTSASTHTKVEGADGSTTSTYRAEQSNVTAPAESSTTRSTTTTTSTP